MPPIRTSSFNSLFLRNRLHRQWQTLFERRSTRDASDHILRAHPRLSTQYSLLAVLKRDQAEAVLAAAAAGNPTPILLQNVRGRWRRLGLYVANGSIVASDDPHAFASEARCVSCVLLISLHDLSIDQL